MAFSANEVVPFHLLKIVTNYPVALRVLGMIAVFVERAAGLKAQYRDRWMIENEYKSIKEHFLPRTTSSDYRVRLFYFVAAVLMYNVWRLTNLLLRTWFDVHLGEKPPVPAGEIIEAIAFCLAPASGSRGLELLMLTLAAEWRR